MIRFGVDSRGLLLNDDCRLGRGVEFGSFRILADQLNEYLVGQPFFLRSSSFPLLKIPLPPTECHMVRTVRRYYRVVRLETASLFKVDGCIYIHHESEVFCDRYKSLRDWIDSKPGVKNRLSCLDQCLESQSSSLCHTCRRDEQVCECEVDSIGLVWGPFGVRCVRSDDDFPF